MIHILTSSSGRMASKYGAENELRIKRQFLLTLFWGRACMPSEKEHAGQT